MLHNIGVGDKSAAAVVVGALDVDLPALSDHYFTVRTAASRTHTLRDSACSESTRGRQHKMA